MLSTSEVLKSGAGIVAGKLGTARASVAVSAGASGRVSSARSGVGEVFSRSKVEGDASVLGDPAKAPSNLGT